MQHTQVKDIMKNEPTFIDISCTLQEAAEQMEKLDCGILPVGNRQTSYGILTDRDIVIRAIAKGKDVTKEKVGDTMTQEVFFCTAEETLEEAADKMHKHHVNRLLVKDTDGHICGILTLGCIMRKTRDSREMNNAILRAVRQVA